MTDIFALTEQLENAVFLKSNGFPNNNTQGGKIPTQPFYVDNQNALNFGYGIMIPVGNTTAVVALRNQVEGILAEFGVPQATITLINQYLVGKATVTDLNNSLSAQDWRSPAADMMRAFYANIVIPGLQQSLGTQVFNGLNNSAQLALEVLKYNATAGFLGSKIVTDLSNKNYADAAFQLAFNTAGASNLAYEDRSLIGAALMLGFSATIDGYNTINSLTASSDMNPQTLISFLQLMKNSTTIAPYIATAPVQGFLSSLDPTFLKLGYYIPVSSDGNTEAAIAASLVKQLNLSGLTSAVLEQINAPFKDTSWTVGGLVHVPIGAPLTPTVGMDKQLPKLPSGQTYIYDQSTKKVYNVGASLDGHDSGALIFDSSTLNNYSTFAQGTYSGLTIQANGNVSVDVINPNGTALGTETFNPLTDTVVTTINNGVTTFSTLIGSGAASEVEDKFSAHTASVVEQYTFSQPNGILKIDSPTSFSGTISGFAPGDTLDLAGIGTATSATLNAGNKLVVQTSSASVTLQLDATADYKDQNFIVTSDGSGGTDITSTSLVGLNSGNIVLVNPETSTPTTLASLGINGFNLGVEAAENGYLYFGSLGKLYTVNLETGAVSSVAATLPGILKADSLTGALVGVSGTNVVAYNPTTGTTKTIASISGLLGVNIQSQAAENGYLYFGGVVSGFQTKFFSVNLTTGQVNSVATAVPFFTGDNSTGTLVGVSGQNVVTINPTTGAQTTIATISGLNGVSLTQVAAENGVFYFVGNTTSNGQHLYAVNIATGQVTTSATTSANFSANNSVRFSVSQLLTYSAGISSGVAGFSVVDTAANIQSNISQLNTLSSSVASITTTDSRISLSASQVGQYSKIAGVISNGVAVSDTAANVVTNMASLQALATAGKLSSITLNRHLNTNLVFGLCAIYG